MAATSLLAALPADADSPVTGSPRTSSVVAPAQLGPAPRAQPPKSAPPAPDDLMTRNAAARTRMLECGHQWSSMKRAGTAAGTWKDFSKVCLARQ